MKNLSLFLFLSSPSHLVSRVGEMLMPTLIDARIFPRGDVSFAKFLFLPSCFAKFLFLPSCFAKLLEQLQQFGKSTWHPSNFGKTRKISLQQFGKPTWQNSPPHAHIYARGSWLPSAFPSRWEGAKERKNRKGFLM
jgi:hypothetical protein